MRAAPLIVLYLLSCGGQSGLSSGSAGQAPAAPFTAGSPASGTASSSAGVSAGGAQGGHTSLEAGAPTHEEGGAGGVGVAGCSAADVPTLALFSGGGWDVLGYPPYALEDCQLLYVASDQALHRRLLPDGPDELIEAASAKPRRPTLAGSVLAWEIDDEDGKSQVRVLSAGTKRTLRHGLDHGGEPRATRDAVVFTAFAGAQRSDDSDVYLYDVASDEIAPVAAGPGQQRFADVSETHVALTDFSEDPRGYFDEVASISDVLVVERRTGQRVLRHLTGKQAFPLLGRDGTLLYLDWGAVHPEPKFSQFWLKSADIAQAPEQDVSLTPEQVRTDPAYVRPSLHGLSVDYIDTRAGMVGLYRVTLGRLEPPSLTSLGAASQLLGPVAADSLTLVATREGQAVTLVAVPR